MTTAPPPPFLFRIWCHWFLLLLLVLSLKIHPHLKIPSFHYFFVSTPRLYMNINITRVIWQRVRASIVSPLGCMSTSAQRTGASICLISPWIRLISAPKDSLSPVMYLTRFCVPCRPWLLQPLIWLPPLFVWLIFTSNAHLSSLKALPIPTLTRKFGSTASLKKSEGSRALLLSARSD